MSVYKKCCKPFPESRCSKNLRSVPDTMKLLLPSSIKTNPNLLMCSTCYINISCKRKKIEIETSPTPGSSNSPVTPRTSSTLNSEDYSSDSENMESELKRAAVIQKLNKILPEVGISPIYQSKLKSRSQHQQQKFVELSNIVQSSSSTLGIEPLPMNSIQKAHLFDEFIDQLKLKFKQLEKNCDKIQLLTTLPKSLSIEQIVKEFNTTQYMVRTARRIQQKNGSMSLPEPKAGKRISDEVRQTVLDYYNDEDVSRIMAGKNDCLTIEKVKIQKRLMMCTLKECYEGYKMKYQDDESKKIGFSKFSLLRPKYCVQPGSSGTHTVCVCVIHQNVKLIIYGTKLDIITNGDISKYQDCISSILCGDPTPTCYLLQCDKCPGLESFRDYLQKAFLEQDCEDAELSFSQWVSTDRCSLEKFVKPLDEFLDYFLIKLQNLIPHCFISQQQSNFIKMKKTNLKHTEVLVSCDFAENYSFIMQNEIQSFYWSKKQATIHPFIVYQNVGGTLQHSSFIIISDCLHHDAVAVHLFIEKLVKFLKTKTPDLSKIYYNTDGAGSQYKNKKNFMNINKHKEDFGVDCEWHFHATAHGKGPCDGVGGTIKRMASRASLTNEYDNIINDAEGLFKWAKNLQTDMSFEFVSETDYKFREIKLTNRYKNLKTIKGTRDFHTIIPSKEGYLICKKYSNCENYVEIEI